MSVLLACGPGGCLVPAEKRKTCLQFLGTGVTGGWESPCGYWGFLLRFPQENQALLTTESFFQLLKFYFVCVSVCL